MASIDLNDPTSLALVTADALAARGIAYALYGGLPLAAYGEPRETRDADFAVIESSPERVEEALRSAGVDAAVSFDNVTFGGLAISRVAVLAGARATGLNTVDLVRPLHDTYARAVLERAITASRSSRSLGGWQR